MISKQIHIVEGNKKIGKTPNISLTPIRSCINCEACKDSCYAHYFYRRYKTARTAWNTNLRILQGNSESYFSQIRRYLLKKSPEYFRWHVSGDILDQSYLDNMKIIASDYFFTKFLVFTKNYSLDFFDIPENLSIVISVWPGVDIPDLDLPLAFINRKDENRAKNYIVCNDDCESCRVCWYLKDIQKNVLLKEVKRR